ncbi:MAG TPA: DUF2304 domain-containing protein [Solirubrobacteraceae bacterium]
MSKAAEQRIEVITVAVIIFLVIFELVRRRHLMERYAILWLTAAVTVLVLSVWTGLLARISRAAGISYLPSALFAVAFLFVLVMLVHFSMTISRLSRQNTVLAQRLALLQERFERPGVERERGQAPQATSPGDDRPERERASARPVAGPPPRG